MHKMMYSQEYTGVLLFVTRCTSSACTGPFNKYIIVTVEVHQASNVVPPSFYTKFLLMYTTSGLPIFVLSEAAPEMRNDEQRAGPPRTSIRQSHQCNPLGLLLFSVRCLRVKCLEPRAARRIVLGTFGRIGQLVSRPPHTGPTCKWAIDWNTNDQHN